MAKTIYKYPIKVIDENLIKMPIDSKILSVQIQNKIPCIWALVDTEKENEDEIIEVFGTGHKVHDLTHNQTREFIGTFQMQGGNLVFHVFKVIRKKIN